MKQLKLLLGLLLILLLPNVLYAQNGQLKKRLMPEKTKELMDWEYDKNAGQIDVKARSEIPKEYFSSYYEIEASKLKVSILPGTDPKLIKAVMVKKNGTDYIRWYLNPEDTKNFQEVETFLKKNNLPVNKLTGGTSRLSASRTCLTLSCQDGYPFFYKGSTNRTGGSWTDTKRVNGNQVRKALLATSLTIPIRNKNNFKNLVTMDEPIGFLIEDGVDQGLIFRSLGEFTKNNHRLIPGFSAIHKEESARIAALNTADPDHQNPAVYWEKHYAAPLGRATAEFIATHGLLPSNAHSQQYLIDLDKNYVPTGKIFFRDFNDSYAYKQFFHDNNPETLDFLQGWMEKYVKEKLSVDFGVFHGSVGSHWLSAQQMNSWAKTFFHEFDTRFSQLTNIPLAFLKEKNKGLVEYKYPFMSYRTKVLAANGENLHPAIKKWLAASECFRGMDSTSNGLNCQDVLDCFDEDKSTSRNGVSCDSLSQQLLDKDKIKDRDVDCSSNKDDFLSTVFPSSITAQQFKALRKSLKSKLPPIQDSGRSDQSSTKKQKLDKVP